MKGDFVAVGPSSVDQMETKGVDYDYSSCREL